MHWRSIDRKENMSNKRLQDKVIIISGGTKGVGRAFAETAAKEGANVVIGGRDEKAGIEVIREIEKAGSKGLFVSTDLLKIEDCDNLFRQGYEKFGKVTGFFNYAGVTPISPLDSCDEATFDWVTNVNYKASFFCCQHAINYMRKNGEGSIVLTGSAHAWGGEKDRAAYAMTKGVLITLCEHIAHQYAQEKIRCNYLTLGWTPTEGELSLRKECGETEEDLRRRAAAILPMGRMCEVQDYMEALVFLMSDDSKMMTGSTLRITAGEYI